MKKLDQFNELKEQAIYIMHNSDVMMQDGKSESEILAYAKTIEPLNERMKVLSKEILEEGKGQVKNAPRSNQALPYFMLILCFIMLFAVSYKYFSAGVS